MEPIPDSSTTRQTLQAGSGAEVTPGDEVTADVTAIVKDSQHKWWSTKGYSFKAGVGKVIAGLDHGVIGMKVGEVRLLEIPAQEAFGEGGHSASQVPPNATVCITLECLKVTPGEYTDAYYGC